MKNKNWFNLFTTFLVIGIFSFFSINYLTNTSENTISLPESIFIIIIILIGSIIIFLSDYNFKKYLQSRGILKDKVSFDDDLGTTFVFGTWLSGFINTTLPKNVKNPFLKGLANLFIDLLLNLLRFIYYALVITGLIMLLAKIFR